ncbi:hypothetical protein [Mesonia mobilis]|jgi:hypothetical protein|uniref:hypothetical protein n=1 Tax=Mesonia mobilis TaxID=369791 RepID=UPI0026F17A59|nr:hypothetical protein [Mesonia mobilis]
MNILLSFLAALVLSHTLPKVKKAKLASNHAKLIESPHQQQDSITIKTSICQLHQLENSCIH